jgi:hypothetical protein
MITIEVHFDSVRCIIRTFLERRVILGLSTFNDVGSKLGGSNLVRWIVWTDP